MDRTALVASIDALARFEFSRAPGPGGQNVNKVSSKVTARLPFSGLEGLNDKERAQAAERLSNRINDKGELWVSVSEERSQEANRRIALLRLFALISQAARLKKRRIPTKPSRSSKESRLEKKRGRSVIKRNRSSSGLDD